MTRISFRGPTPLVVVSGILQILLGIATLQLANMRTTAETLHLFLILAIAELTLGAYMISLAIGKGETE